MSSLKLGNIGFRKPKARVLWLLAFAFIFQGLYYLLSNVVFSTGFPLDDAWIHQTYARNLASYGQWEFVPGQISGGSTSPLWTLLLVPGHLPGGNFFMIWTFLISLILFWVSSVLFEMIVADLSQTNYPFPIFGLLFLSEWHLVWASNSGMETMLFISVLLALLYLILKDEIFSLKFAIISALLIWIRPDAVSFLFVIAAFVLKDILQAGFQWKKYWKITVLFGVSLAAYGVFNDYITGSFFPNTYYAKQTEYAILYESQLINRLFNIFLVPLTGMGILFLPTFISQIGYWFKRKDFHMLALPAWLLIFYGVYALRLSVTYQHGRYFIPTIPIFLLIGVLGANSLKPRMENYRGKLIALAWKLSVIAITVVFYGLGGNAFAQDVAIIQTEMVETAKWIRKNTQPTALIAAHDIGALGYFGDRQIVDLAGLISPEIIPYMSDEQQLRDILDQKEVDYLMTFPDWYSTLQEGKKILYQGDEKYVIEAGGTHMSVYDWGD